MKEILKTNIRPFFFEGKLILTLDPEWQNLFDGGGLVFDALIMDGHLVIQSTKEVNENKQ